MMIRASATPPTPAPIPALAPVLRPPLVDTAEGVEDGVGELVLVLANSPVTLLVEEAVVETELLDVLCVLVCELLEADAETVSVAVTVVICMTVGGTEAEPLNVEAGV